MRRTLFALTAAALVGGAVYVALPQRAEVPAPVEAAPSPAPIVAKPIAVKKEAPQNFDAVQDSLPTTDKLSELSTEEVHNTPKEILEASRKIGELVAAVQKDPSQEPAAMEFYGKCTRREELPLSIRAHCLHNLRGLGNKRGEKVDESGISESVGKLEGP